MLISNNKIIISTL